MLIALQKRRENISEYLLYMFQVEDMIRAFNFDIDSLDQAVIANYQQPYDVKRDIREWYLSIIRMMKDHGLVTSGHIPMLQSLIAELTDIHLRLLQNPDAKDYHQAFQNARPFIEELRSRSAETGAGDVALCLNGLYGLLLLKLKQQKINPETLSAFGSISELVSLLSAHFKQLEKGASEL
jgi:hypothetical protein